MNACVTGSSREGGAPGAGAMAVTGTAVATAGWDSGLS